MTTSSSSNTKSYFDLHTSGIGYLQDIREVPVRGGRRAQPFLACKIAALVGPARDPSYRLFDLKVSGAKAKELVESYKGVNDRRNRPLVRFRIGDLWPDPFIRTEGERKGEPAAGLKGRLLKAELVDRGEFMRIENHELITRGIGYLNRPEEVRPKDGDPYLACCVAALAGPTDEPEYRYIETKVRTESAAHLVRRCMQAVEAERKVLISFFLNDMKIDAYLRTKGERAGEAAASLEANLVHIGLIKIDGQKVYPLAAPNADAQSTRHDDVCAVEGASDSATAHAPEPAEREPESEEQEREPEAVESF
ncbi:DUF3577 domain-containing protein [Xanthomonas sp. CFBP 8445]|uniref:DUF3577 domain-containing protein n=1 Tax=Xanthomonas sp. CFBP 8445 TaxID=2971236 RepID=UPI001C551D4F|nr:DUF3577 domain-containing protein [Xanthomonas sp. CFBP 8445]UYC11858.1 DUF3577 domain-containing protein [Xanthomonas sp. CFBP 8445]